MPSVRHWLPAIQQDTPHPLPPLRELLQMAAEAWDGQPHGVTSAKCPLQPWAALRTVTVLQSCWAGKDARRGACQVKVSLQG